MKRRMIAASVVLALLVGVEARADSASITVSGTGFRGPFTDALTCTTSGSQLSCAIEAVSGFSCNTGQGSSTATLPLGTISQLAWDETETVLAKVCAQTSLSTEFCWNVEATYTLPCIQDIELVLDPAASSALDTDGDGAKDYEDAFPFDPAETADTDKDGVGENADNCPLNGNANQADRDNDDIGDVCDSDNDNDSILDADDNCPLAGNADQQDSDGDGLGDACDPDPNDADSDGDGVFDPVDNCALASNADQLNTDGDAEGDACDSDDDGDSVADASDNCPLVSNSDQLDSDGDKRGNVCDAFPSDFCGYTDTDGDGKPDVMNCFRDTFTRTTLGAPWRGNNWTVNGAYARTQTAIAYLELDIVLTAPTSFSFNYRTGIQGLYTVNGATQFLPSAYGPGWGSRSGTLQAGSQTLQWYLINIDNPLDVDNVAIGPVTSLVLDEDDDNDGLADSQEPARGTDPLVADSDGDGALDGSDAFPLDASESLDTDNDGAGNNVDTDDDNDGMSDAWETYYGLNPLVNDAAENPDDDDYTNLEEYQRDLHPFYYECVSYGMCGGQMSHDFNIDCNGDIFLRNPTTGQNQIWLTACGKIIGTSVLTTNAQTFEVAAFLDADGDFDTDILWYDSAQGKLIFWRMQNGAKQANAFLGNTTAKLSGLGDFDGDGDDDILLKTAAGDVKIWTIQNLALVLSTNLGNPGGTYQVIDTGDFNGDGVDDIVMQNAAGAVRIWQLNSSAQLATTIDVATISTAYKLKKSGDTDNDGDDDLVFRNDTTGQTLVWVMQDGARQQQNVISAQNPAMGLAAVNDFDQDGDEDLLFRDSTPGDSTDGNTIIWKMENSVKASNSFLGNNAVTNILQAVLDLNSDYEYDLLYRDSSTGKITGWRMVNGARVKDYDYGNPGAGWEPRF